MASVHNSDAQGLRQRSTLATSRSELSELGEAFIVHVHLLKEPRQLSSRSKSNIMIPQLLLLAFTMAVLQAFESVLLAEAFATRTPPHDYAGVRLGSPVHVDSFRHPSRVVRDRTVAVDGGGKGAAGSSTLGVEGARGALSAARNHRWSCPSSQNVWSTLGATAASSAAGDGRGATASAAAIDVPPSKALLVRGGDNATPAYGFPVTDVVTVKGVREGKLAALHCTPRNILVLDKVEDALVNAWDISKVILWPMLHSVRLCFGLCLLFYGMAFRTLAFHIIVQRLSGLRQVQSSLAQLGGKYSSARQALREAAAAAENIGDRLSKPNSLKATRDRMIKEKKLLLADGILTAEETEFFMNKYNDDLDKIIKEQELFKSARSSMLSAKTAFDLGAAQISLNGVYNAIVASFTASTLQAAGRIALGLHIGRLLKTHVLDLFGPILDPVGYRLDLNTYFDKQKISYMGKANAMGGAANITLNTMCYSVVFALFHVHPKTALKVSMVYYAAKVVTDYIVRAWDFLCRRRGRMPIAQTPWSGCIQAALTFAGWYFHRDALYAAGAQGAHVLVVGPGAIGLLEPAVRAMVNLSEILHNLYFFNVGFVQDSMEAFKGALF